MTETGSDKAKLIFIGGSPRSGTTLVQNMLDSHPLILGGPEFLHLPDIIDLRRKLHASIAREWIDLFCSREDVDNHLIKVINNLFLPLAQKHGCQFYSEKTPGNILVFSELLELFPSAHFIQVVRDPRAILSSMQQVKQRAVAKGVKPAWFTVDMFTSTAYVKRCVDAGTQAARRFPERVLTVSYEQLVADPERETQHICRHLGIKWDARMLRPGDQKHLGVRAITTKSNEIWYAANTYRQNVTSLAVEKWKTKLSLFQQVYATLAFAGHSELKRFGYDFSMHGLGVDRRFASRILIRSLHFAIIALRWMRRGIRSIRKKG